MPFCFGQGFPLLLRNHRSQRYMRAWGSKKSPCAAHAGAFSYLFKKAVGYRRTTLLAWSLPF